MFNVYEQHTKPTIVFPPVRSIREVKTLAECAALAGNDSFFRVFERTATGEMFVTAFSVLRGKVREHKDVTFPKEHWG